MTHFTRTLASFFVCIAILSGCSSTPAEQFTVPALKERSEAQNSPEFERIKDSYSQMKAKYEKDTNDAAALTKLAEIFVVEARATGDHHYYYPAALSVIDRSLAKKPDDFEALVTKGTVLMTFHRFTEALDIAERANRVSQGGNAYVFGLLTDANIELGNYDQAIAMSDKMQALRPDLRSYSRAAYLREIYGDRVGAKKAMKMAGESGMFGMEDKAWAFNEFAKLYLGEGALDTAEFIYKGILEERPNYAHAMSGLAMVAAARDDYKTAIELLTKAATISDEHVFDEQLADMYVVAGDAVNAKKMQEMALFEFRDHGKAGWQVNREFAEFALSHGIELEEALKRATEDYNERKNNIDAASTYAYALAMNGKTQEAIPIIEQAMRLKTDNAQLYFRAAVIYDKAGKKEMAKTWLEKATKLNPYLTPLTRKQAKEMMAAYASK